MRMTIVLASLCSFLISCATLTGGGEKQASESSTQESSSPLSLESNTASEASGHQAYAASDMGGDSAMASLEVQAVENHETQSEAMNEQRSQSELDAAAPEGTGTDNFYASAQSSTVPEPMTSTESAMEPVAAVSESPQGEVASWDQQAAEVASPIEDESPAEVESPAVAKSKKIAKSHKKDKKKIAKKSKKSKKELAKKSKKSNKQLAKKSKHSKKSLAKKSSKLNCKKIAKNGKKASKREIASCRAEKKKVSQKAKKSRRVAHAG